MDVILYTFVCLVSCAAIIEAATPTLSVSISPAHVHLTPGTSENVRVTCVAAANITRCQFRVGNRGLIDPRLGTNSQQTAGYVYDGDHGRCEVTLRSDTFGKDGNYKVVGCRVGARGSDWSYATMTVYASKRRALALDVAHSEVTAFPGEVLSVLANASTSLDTCSAHHDGVWLSLDDVTPCEGSVCYHGGGLERGQCGVTLNNVSEGDNGRLWLRATDADFAEGMQLVRVIVTKRPEYVNMKYNVTADNGVKSTLKAWCSVVGGRPTPKVTWYLSGVKIDEGVVSIPGKEWAWPEDEKTIKQSLTRTLRDVDVGKELRCTASFLAEGKTLSAAERIEYVGGGPSTSPTTTTTKTTTTGAGIVVTDPPKTIANNEDSADGGYSVAACVLFGLAIFLYVTLVSLTDFTMFAWRRRLCCFKRFSYESGASLDNDVMDYHPTKPSRAAMRDPQMESYLEPIQQRTPGRGQETRDSYFLPTTTESKRVSTKPERTLGMELTGRAPMPTPRNDQAPNKKQKANTSSLKKKKKKLEQNSLFMLTPVDLVELEQPGAAGRYKPAATEDEVPIYSNLVTDSVSEPPSPPYLDIIATDDAQQPVYANFDTLHSRDIVNPRTIIDDSDPVYGNFGTIEKSNNIVNPRTIIGNSDPVYGNFGTIEKSNNIVNPRTIIDDSDPVYGNFGTIEKSNNIVNPPTIIDDSDPVYGNFDALHSHGIVNPRTIIDDSDPVYGNFGTIGNSADANTVNPRPLIEDCDDPVYGNFDAIENSHVHQDVDNSDPVYGNF